MSGTEASGRMDVVDVWLVDVGAVGEPGAASTRLLDDGERAALDRLRVERDRRRYLVAHVLLRLALSRAAKGRVPPARWRFDRPAGGRPSVARAPGAPRLDFSLSRSSGLAAVAVARAEDCRVGVDAECRDRPLCCIPADVALSSAERSRLATFPPDRQPSEFLRLWTLKEAYGKLCGRGICFPLEQTEVGVCPAGTVRADEGYAPPTDVHWETQEVRTTTGVYYASLAARCPPGVRPHAAFHILDTVWPGPGEDPRLPGVERAVEHGSDEEGR